MSVYPARCGGWRRVLAAVGVALGVSGGLAPRAARADEGGLSVLVVAVPRDSASQKMASVGAFVARKTFARNPRYHVLDVEAFLDDRADNPARTAITTGLAALTKGSTAIDELEMEPAIAALNEAVIAFEQGAAYLEDIRPYVAALMKLGTAYALNADAKGAQEAFRRALVLDRTLDGQNLPQQAKKPFAEAVKKVEKADVGSLSVFTTPSAAEVYVDGVFHGATPVVVERLTAGPHVLRLVKPGFRSAGRTFKITGRGEENIQVSLKTALKTAEWENLIGQLSGDVVAGQGPALVELARYARVDQAFVMVVQSSATDVRVNAVLVDGTGHPLASGQRSFPGERYKADLDTWLEGGFRGGQSGTPAAGTKDLPPGTTSNYGTPTGGSSNPGLPKIIAGILLLVPIPLGLLMGALFACTSSYAFLAGWSLAPIPMQGNFLYFLPAGDDTMLYRVLLWIASGVLMAVALVHPVAGIAALAGGIALILWGRSEKESMEAILAGGGSDAAESQWRPSPSAVAAEGTP